MVKKSKVAILGYDERCIDLLIKVLKSAYLQCGFFLGNHAVAKVACKSFDLDLQFLDQDTEVTLDQLYCCDVVFNVSCNSKFADILQKLDKIVIQLEPTEIGTTVIPAVNLSDCLREKKLNMSTFSGQATIPLVCALKQVHDEIDYIEVVSTISSLSANANVRVNLDNYIEKTEEDIKFFSHCKVAKAILNLNPASSGVGMQATVFAKIAHSNMQRIRQSVEDMVESVRIYIPNYELIVPPVLENNYIAMTVRIKGLGDYLPTYAGNLDIINCSAMAIAEKYAKSILI